MRMETRESTAPELDANEVPSLGRDVSHTYGTGGVTVRLRRWHGVLSVIQHWFRRPVATLR